MLYFLPVVVYFLYFCLLAIVKLLTSLL